MYKKFVTIEFPELSDDSQTYWVKIKNPAMLNQNIIDEFIRRSGISDGGDVESVSFLKALEAHRWLASQIIVEWNLTDPDSDSDEIIPLPCTEESLRLLPVSITRKLMETANAGMNPT